jgi:hypothetical protein
MRTKIGQPREPMRIDRPEVELNATYLSRRHFLEHAQVGANRCRLLWPGPAPLYPGARVRVGVSFGAQAGRFVLHGEALSEHANPSEPVASSWVLECTGAAMREFGEAVAFAAGRPIELGRRRTPRHRVQVPVRMAYDGTVRAGSLLDLGFGGAALVASDLRPSLGAPVLMTLRMGLFRDVAFFGRVAWLDPDRSVGALGVEFVDSDARARRWLGKTLARLAAIARDG